MISLLVWLVFSDSAGAVVVLTNQKLNERLEQCKGPSIIVKVSGVVVWFIGSVSTF